MDNSKKNVAVLFDFDGVVVDTETQYSVFWHRVGMDYLGMPDLEGRIKGQTLTYIYKTFFPDMTDKQAEITAALDRFEQEMDYPSFPACSTLWTTCAVTVYALRWSPVPTTRRWLPCGGCIPIWTASSTGS